MQPRNIKQVMEKGKLSGVGDAAVANEVIKAVSPRQRQLSI